MADLRSEIEARKSRIAELKKQREALALNGLNYSARSAIPAPSKQSSIITLRGPHVEIEPSHIYTRSIQTERLEVRGSEPVQNNDNNNFDDGTGFPIDPDIELSEEVQVVQNCANNFKVADSPDLPPSCIEFLDDCWRAVARSGVHPPAIRDYTSVPDLQSAGDAGKTINKTLTKLEELQNHSNVLAWSPHFDDLLVTRSQDPRRAFVWSTEAPDHPEFVLKSPTIITALVFSPHNAHQIYAGGINGQIIAWDLKERARTGGARFELLPELKSPIENSRIIGLQFVGINLISLNEDGIIHVWGDVLSRPRHSIILEDRFQSILPSLKAISGTIVPTSMGIFSAPDVNYGLGYGTGTCIIGTMQGQLFRLPTMPTASPHPFTWRHNAPVTCLAFRPHATSASDEDDIKRKGSILLSGGLDWKIRVWLIPHNENEAPIELATLNIDYAVSSLAWHPTTLSVFVAMGENTLQVWNLDKSYVKPVYSTKFPYEAGSDTIDTADLTTLGFNGSILGVATPKSTVLYRLGDDPSLHGSDTWLLSNHKY